MQSYFKTMCNRILPLTNAPAQQRARPNRVSDSLWLRVECSIASFLLILNSYSFLFLILVPAMGSVLLVSFPASIPCMPRLSFTSFFHHSAHGKCFTKRGSTSFAISRTSRQDLTLEDRCPQPVDIQCSAPKSQSALHVSQTRRASNWCQYLSNRVAWL